MIVKYKHISDPEVEKFHNTEGAFKKLHSPFNPYCYKTQEEFDAFTLKHLAKDKENGIIISYEVMEELK
jgi:hypothetical protein